MEGARQEGCAPAQAAGRDLRPQLRRLTPVAAAGYLFGEKAHALAAAFCGLGLIRRAERRSSCVAAEMCPVRIMTYPRRVSLALWNASGVLQETTIPMREHTDGVCGRRSNPRRHGEFSPPTKPQNSQAYERDVCLACSDAWCRSLSLLHYMFATLTSQLALSIVGIRQISSRAEVLRRQSCSANRISLASTSSVSLDNASSSAIRA
jgi:hypothetical protein